MKSPINHPVKVTVTGFVVLLLLSLSLFWCRWLCEATLGVMMPRDCRYATIQPSGLVPPELEKDPNVVSHSKVEARIRIEEPVFFNLGIVDYFEAREPGRRCSNIYYYHKDENDEDWIYFDESTGQIVCHYTYRERLPDKTLLLRKVQLYAGPKGVSETADKTLGRFVRPIVDRRLWDWRALILYDKKIRRFYKINFKEKTVVKGPQLKKDDPQEPIQIGLLSNNSPYLYLRWEPPMVKTTREEAKEKGNYYRRGNDFLIPIIDRNYRYSAGKYSLVLNATGRIELLDRETLEFAGTAVRLPALYTLFPSKEYVTPKDLLAYRVMPLAFKTDSKYRGMFAASVCREGTAMALAVFDENGKVIKREYSRLAKQKGSRTTYLHSSKAVFFEAPWAPTTTIAKYLLENLHPPLLSLASYFTADSIEATAGRRALFILPNSFIAMKGRDVRNNMTERFFTALMMILPSILLAIFLAWRVSEDATNVGLSENAKLLWMLGTIAFGLAAYITYRLTQPDITLVTCANCGKMRRPDIDRCHRCGSKWHVPEITPPTWRVLG